MSQAIERAYAHLARACCVFGYRQCQLLDGTWPYFGLIGGGIYVYFAGRGILARFGMQRGGFRVGDLKTVRLGLIMLAVWGVVGLITVVTAAITLSSV